MKRFLILLFLVPLLNWGQGSLICDDIEPFCSEEGLTFDNSTNSGQPPYGPNYGCFSSQPNPAFFYMEIAESGPIQIMINQTSGDVDFAMWGPFDSYSEGCDLVMSGIAPIQQSYSIYSSETIGLGTHGGGNLGSCYGTSTPPTPQVGEVYIVMVTNYSNQSGTITFTQTNSNNSASGSTNCSIICSISNIIYVLTDCDPVTNTFSLSGSLDIEEPPENGLLVIEDCNGNSVSFSPPFDETIEFSISDILADGADCELTVTLYDYDNDSECIATSTHYTNIIDCHCDVVEFDSLYVINVTCEDDCDGEISLHIENPHNVQVDYSIIYEGNTITSIDSIFTDLCEGNYLYIIEYAGDCTFYGDTILGVEYSNPIIDFNISDTTGCSPIEIYFESTNDSCIWDLGNGDIRNICNFSKIYEDGSYHVYLEVTNEHGCTSDTVLLNYINITETPIVSFELYPEEIDNYNNIINFVNNSTGAIDYKWSFGDGVHSDSENPQHEYDVNSEGYVITLIGYNGECTDTMKIYLKSSDELIFYIPNSFTPDNDNFNETFRPIFTSGFEEENYRLIIYNRWGEIVFESYNPNVGWDGTYNNKLVRSGTYIWNILVKESGVDKYHEYTGHVNILR